GEFEYVSRTAAVKFHGDVDQVDQCGVTVDPDSGEVVSTCPRCEALRLIVDPSGPAFGSGEKDSEIDITYRSSAGSGQAIACVSAIPGTRRRRLGHRSRISRRTTAG